MADTAATIKKEGTMAPDMDRQLYEFAYVLDGNQNEEKAKEIAGSIRALIEKRDALIIEDTQPKLRKLAYPIAKHIAGFFGWIKFLTQAADIRELGKQIKKIPEVIRMLTVKSYREEFAERRTHIRKRIETPEEKERVKEIDKKLEEILGE